MNLSDYPIEHGRYLIEASAGTGKTYTITHLILRLILRGVPVRKILVTTFSNAAAGELKARILELLNEELNKLIPKQQTAEAPASVSGAPDGQCQPDFFEAAAPDAGQRIRTMPSAEDMKSRILLQLAVSSMDEMTVSTIHGFCQKMLREFALKSGTGFETELAPDESEYVDRLVRAFCRNRFYGGIPNTVGYRRLHAAASFATEPVDADEADGETLNEQQALCREVYRYVRDRIQAEKNRDGVMSYNDMIRDLDAALQDNDALAKLIRSRYQAVFVDEFQDTDRLQYRIFDKCFPKGGPSLFYMIGDPKQAIYGFRGADIYTYLQAKETADARFTLTRNFRSSPDMIRAVNLMFGDGELEEGHETEGVFLQKDIPFVSIASGMGHEGFPGDPGGTLRLRHYIGSKSECDGLIAADVVREIRYLLSEGCAMQVFEKESDPAGNEVNRPRPLRASDIAVLVQTNAQAAEFVSLLNREGIAASACKSGKVYQTREARLMLLLLQGILHPDTQVVRGLMLSPFFRVSGDDIAVRPVWTETLLKQMVEYGRIWAQAGLPAAFLQFLDTPAPHDGVSPRERILSEFNGERMITNFIQLMELLYQAETRDHLLPEDVFDSLNLIVGGRKESDAGDSEDDPDQLRLDRDSASVQIMTMFVAKGLEFPVVFVPYPAKTDWGHMIPKETVAYRVNTAAGNARTPGVLLDFGMSDENRTVVLQEGIRNGLRLLYVALTRASLVTYLYTQQVKKLYGQSTNFTKSAQGVLLASHARPDGAGETVVEQLWDSGYFAETKDYMPQPTAEWWTDLDEEEDRKSTAFHTRRHDVFERHFGVRRGIGPLRPEDMPETMAAARFSGEIRDNWAIMSFSAFHNILTNRADVERETAADLDEQNNTVDTTVENGGENESGGDAPGVPSVDLNLFRGFPRGTTVGSMTHRLLELCAGHFDLFVPERLDEPSNLEAIKTRIAGVLREFGFDPEDGTMKQQLLDGVSRTLQIPLPELSGDAGPVLSELEQDRMVSEMEFFLDAPASLDLNMILSILSDTASGQAQPLVSRENAAFDKNGVLNGIIDLVFEHGGKYYIVDWKTNWLGDSDADYAPGRIRAAMGQAGYVLQSYLYSAALLQMLRQRGLDHGSFGGVYYIFLRGLNRGTRNGIWADVPPRECLEKLLALFRKGAGK